MASIEKRKSANGEVSYRVKVRLKGFPSQTASFTQLTKAKQWAQATESALREGRHFKTIESKKHTLKELIDRYAKQLKQRNPKRYKGIKHHLEWWSDEIGYAVLSEVSKTLVLNARDKLSAGENSEAKRSNGTVNRYMATLSHIFSTALNEYEWIEKHPLAKISKLSEPRGRIRFLSDDERERLLEACKASRSKHLYPIVVLALSTGARRGEILNLQWSDIELGKESGKLILYETKNKEIRPLPVMGHALKVLKKLHAQKKSAYVFPSHDRQKGVAIRTSWETALKLAEINDFRFHDLRHSAASYLAMNGATLAEIAAVLGHKTLQMVKRYAHLSESHTASVVEKMNQRIFDNE